MQGIKIKKLLLEILFLVFATTAYTQNKSQINYHFCAMNGTCFNQPPDWKARIETEEFDSYDMLSQTIDFLAIHPDFIMIDSASKRYNCHGYAYSIFQGGDTLFIDWGDNLCSFNGANIESFVQITELDIRPGDIITAVDSTIYPYTSPHSFIVVSEDTVISKFHNKPLVKHYKYDSYIVNDLGLGTVFPYVYYRRNVNSNNSISGPSSINSSGTYTFTPDVTPTNCTWSVEPAAMFQVPTGTGYSANLSYATPFVYLAPKATITFTFSYGCENHYTVSKEFDLRIPTTTVSGNAVSEGFVIDANATVTVTGKIIGKRDAKTIVPIGSRLKIDGGTMTSEDNVMWQGIEVWGNYFTHQYFTNGSFGQGYLELKNGAVIENAKCAVELWRPDYWSTTGGIIHATDATFRNNATAVHALCYTNHHPATNSEVSYNAFFNNCTFVVDDGYLGNETFHRHVTLADVSGITFSGCDFSADRRVSGVHPWCIGISAYDASFLVDSPCTSNSVPCPDEDLDHSTFTGLCSGIRAGGGRHPRSFTVRNTLFTNNDFGIYAENTDFPTILFNDFRIGGSCDFNYGVCLRNVTGFCIEENLFRPYSKLRSTTIGIAVYHSNGVNDIYHNTFQNLSRANLALGQNTTGGTNGTLQGLTYTCNEFSGNQRDIMVLQRDGAGDIQSQQGSSSCPSGNTFSNSTFQVYNDGLHQIDYYYNSSEADETPNPSLLYRVNRQGTTNANACATHYGNSPVVKSPSEKSALEAEYLSAYNAYSNLRRLYESHMDNSGAQDPTADNSPTTEMLQIGAQMAYYSHKYRLAAGDIIRSNLNDSIANPTELRTWLGNMNDIAADRMAISSYLQEGDSASAFALANTLPALYGLQGGQLSDHTDYLRLLQLYQTLNRTHRNVFQLTQEETGLVADIADNGNGVSQSMAMAMMEHVSNRETSPCLDPELPDSERGEKGWNGYTGVASNRATAFDVTLSPNPATTWTTVNYTLPGNTTKAVLTLTNMLGVNVLTKELDGSQGNKVIDLSGFATGVYVYTIRYEQFTETGKLVITK